jgi:hypothetical protein
VVKEFLRERNVSFELKDLNVDATARGEFVEADYPLPPLTVIDGNIVIGFNPERLEELIAAAMSG